VRGPSPPDVPLDATVSFDLTSSLICRRQNGSALRSRHAENGATGNVVGIGAYMSCPGPSEEEDDEQDEWEVPRVDGMRDGCQKCDDDSSRRERVLGVGAVAEQGYCRSCDDGPHGRWRLS